MRVDVAYPRSAPGGHAAAAQCVKLRRLMSARGGYTQPASKWTCRSMRHSEAENFGFLRTPSTVAAGSISLNSGNV